MTAMTPDWLNALALLDEALDQRPADLEPWLNRAAASQPRAVPLLRKLLKAHGRVESRDILATLPKLKRSTPLADVGAAGLRVGPYELIAPIGRGGMGSVWRARYADGRLKREVAIKLPAGSGDLSALATLRERFTRERDFLAQLEHPNIARLYDAGVSDAGQPYLAMEYVAGLPLTEHCDALRLPVRARLEIFLQVLDAVGHAHQQLVLHRDLKASNVLVDEQGQVRLLDFGVARLLPPVEDSLNARGVEADAASDLTERAGAAFTLGHAAPEQVTHGALSTATDVYALGVMLHHLLTGLSPYQPARDTRGALEDAVLLTTPAAASSRSFSPEALLARQCTADGLRKALRGDIDVILGQALKKNPAERYPTVAALADDLRRHLSQQPISARADGYWYRSRLFVARNRWAVTASTLAAVALLATAGTAVWQAHISARNAALAAKEAARANTAQKFFAGLLSNADPEKNKNITAADRQVVDQALSEAERLFAEAPETLVIVLRQLGEIYDRLGITSKYLQVQKKRVALLKTLADTPADEIVDANVELAYSLRFSDIAEERDQALTRSMAAQEMAVALHAGDHLRVRSLCAIADLYLKQGNYKLADELAAQAVELAEKSLPRPHPELSRAYDQRGATATRLGEFDAARNSFKEAMKVGAMTPTRGKVAQLESQKNLAQTEYAAGNYLAAKREALSALDYAHRHLGEMEGTLTSFRVSATLASERAGELDEAKRLAQTIFASDLASGNPFRAARAQYVQGVVALARGEFQPAAQAFLAAEPGLVIEPRWSRQLALQQATLQLKLGQTAAAYGSLSALVSGIRAAAGTASEEFSTAAERLGVASARVQKAEPARSLFDEACQWRRAKLKSSHPARVRCESYIVLLSEKSGTAEKMKALDEQLKLLTQGRDDKPALMASIARAQEWLNNPRSNEIQLRSFPLLD